MAYDFVRADSENFRFSGFAPVTPLTMACWFNSDDITNVQTLLAAPDSGANGHYHRVFLWGSNNDKIGIQTGDAGGNSIASTAGSYSITTWHHACGVSATTTDRRVYLDGTNDKGTNAVLRTPAGIDRFAIGALDELTPGAYMDGRIAEVGVWDIALTDAEVDVLAAGYSPLFVRPQSLVFYAPLMREKVERISAFTFTDVGTPVVAAHPRIIYPARARIIHVPAAAAVSNPWYAYANM